MSDSLDSLLLLETGLATILRAHGMSAPLVARDAAKRLWRAGFRMADQTIKDRCRGNARHPGCGESRILSQGLCVVCLAKSNGVSIRGEEA